MKQIVKALKRNAKREAMDEKLEKGYDSCFLYTKPIPDHLFIRCEVHAHGSNYHLLIHKLASEQKNDKIRASFIFVSHSIIGFYNVFSACEECTVELIKEFREFEM